MMVRRAHLRHATGVGMVLLLGLVLGLLAAPSGSPIVEPQIEQVAVTQRAALTMHPQLVQPGSTPQSATKAKSVMTASFKPIRKGRAVILQQYRAGRWVKVAAGRQNGRGQVDFRASYAYNGRVAKYRAVALRGGGLPKKATTAKATNYWGASDFLDDFSGTSLSAKWGVREAPRSAAASRTCSQVDASRPAVASGTARIQVRRDPNPKRNAFGQVTNCPVNNKPDWREGDSIGTQSSFSFRYGYAAARVKLNPGDGVHPSFWLAQAPGAAHAEIDVVEWFGNRANNNTELMNGTFDFSVSPPKKYGGYLADTYRYGSNWYSAYHVFSVEWRPGLVIFRIDGKETRRLSGRAVTDQFVTPILSMHSSDFEYNRITASELPQTMHVDWVRIWDRSRTS